MSDFEYMSNAGYVGRVRFIEEDAGAVYVELQNTGQENSRSPGAGLWCGPRAANRSYPTIAVEQPFLEVRIQEFV
jgi:hypothetical protein